ncbi:CpsD/CapB family tyrosine-protein kinase [Pelosinus baikalensis]|uniref:non-specific protein-tyrosine kinase n=1 Tax=Pelosinus baikalensis TaxID=2892015 RepID=A0ABS8HLS7_9FIRM|nr:CpsD/CapB family tyrosine-protein kinase [Pelosinus baikalensis]MCC5464136.1 CpsD/CapB family tyrosine-protein kinase [Pelosinus baikalensis]
MTTTRKLIVYEDAKSPIAEAYRTLRTNIQFSKTDGELKTIMFTSSGPGEGKSTTIANTAVALAQSGKKVILVDCDLRKPVQHKIFGKKNRGVTNILVEEIETDRFIQETQVENLRLLTSGPIPPNPSELLGSAKMQELIKYLKTQADYVIIDAPPVIAVTDASVLASKVDGITLIINSGSVRPEMAQKAKDLLIKANGHLLGVILNRVEIEEEHAYYYYYYGSDDKKIAK